MLVLEKTPGPDSWQSICYQILMMRLQKSACQKSIFRYRMRIICFIEIIIVIAAPYWDLSFPAVLKQYLEQVSVVDITFTYTPEGIPKGLCKAKRLYYVTTAGGDYAPDEYGFGYVESLCKSLYGIQDVKLIKAVGLDIVGADVENILAESKKEIDL